MNTCIWVHKEDSVTVALGRLCSHNHPSANLRRVQTELISTDGKENGSMWRLCLFVSALCCPLMGRFRVVISVKSDVCYLWGSQTVYYPN